MITFLGFDVHLATRTCCFTFIAVTYCFYNFSHGMWKLVLSVPDGFILTFQLLVQTLDSVKNINLDNVHWSKDIVNFRDKQNKLRKSCNIGPKRMSCL